MILLGQILFVIGVVGVVVMQVWLVRTMLAAKRGERRNVQRDLRFFALVDGGFLVVLCAGIVILFVL